MDRPNRYPGLLLVPLVLLLTSCGAEVPPRGVVDLSVDGTGVEAWIDVGGNSGLELHESVDGGRTWLRVESLESATSPGETVTEACLPEGPCFRIDRKGDTAVWQVQPNGADSPAWSFPPGRLEFLERYGVGAFGFGAYDPAPRDIVVVRDVVLVAMGNDGVLRRAPDGTWERGVLGGAEAFAQWGSNLQLEMWLVVMATAFLMAVVMLISFTRFAGAIGWVRAWGLLGPWVAVGYLSTIPALFVAFSLAAYSVGAVLPAILLIPTFAAAGTTWSRMFPDGYERSGTWRRILLLGVPGAGILGLLPFLLWSGGVIARYDLALVLSIGVAVVALITTLVAMFRAQPGSPTDISPTTTADTPPAPTTRSIHWKGGVMVSAGTLFFCLVLLLPFHLLADPSKSTLARLLLALLGLLVGLLSAEGQTRDGPPGRYAWSGLGASLLGGPGVAAMFVLPSPGGWGTANRVLLYLIYWILGGTLLLLAGNFTRIPGMLTLIFGALLTISPLCIPAADWWSLGGQQTQSPPTD